jgi:putative NIF3 family GTP cyclohydrolase 1 type 2
MADSSGRILIRDIVAAIEKRIPADTRLMTNDTFKSGSPDSTVTGIVVTFMATRQVLQKAAGLKANLIITHEPTFYGGQDETDWLAQDPVYLSKKAFLEKNGLVVWRFHDGWHRHQPDGILQGMVQALGWEMPRNPAQPNVCEIAPLSLRGLAEYCRDRLQIAPPRFAGDPDLPCSRILLLPGACGGRRQMVLLQQSGADVVICGESPEWETCEYVRDSAEAGVSKGLIVLGHANSEEEGMRYGAEWLKTFLPSSIPLHYIPAGDPFQTLPG